MSTLSLRANLVLLVAAAAALTASLGMPWYGPSPRSDTASVENLVETARHVFMGNGVDGHTSLGTAGDVLLGLAGVLVVAALLCLLAPLEDVGRTLAQLAALAALGVIVVKVFDQPGVNTAVDLRYGIFGALVSASVALAAAGAVAAKPHQRKPPPRMVDVRRA